MSKIKICHVVNIITGKSDGVYAHLKMLFKYVDTDRFEHYLVFQGNPIIEEEAKKLGVVVLPLPSLKRKFSISVFIKLYKFLKENQIDIIQAHLIKPYVIVGIVNIFLRKKAIFNFHGSFTKLPIYYNKLEQLTYEVAHLFIYFFRSYDRVVVPSKASKNLLLAESSLFPKMEVYYNGAVVAENKFADVVQGSIIPHLTLHKHRIGVIGRLEPEKRVDVAIQIARMLLSQRGDVYFVIAGDGTLEERIKNLVQNLQIMQKVTVLGFVPNVQAYLHNFDIVLLTSDWEGLPLVMWESMAKGVPIVASDVGGIREIVETEKCGKVFERRNVIAAVEILNELLDNRTLREEMGANGRLAIEQKYNTQTFARRFEEIYSDVLNS
jgi:glycosyltransferase involved in cell wall biosynthesis